MATNYLLGRGELLTAAIEPPGGGGEKVPVYSFQEARERLIPQIVELSRDIQRLPQSACPGGIAVARFVVHPSYIAKSFFPSKFLSSVELLAIGSRTVRIRPERTVGRKATPTEDTTELFVAGLRSSFETMAHRVESFQENSREAIQFAELESVEPFAASQKIRGTADDGIYEVCLHAPTRLEELATTLLSTFKVYAHSLGIDVLDRYSHSVGGLLFAPVNLQKGKVEELARFSMVRTMRPMPRLRRVRPLTREASVPLRVSPPNGPPVSDFVRAAILDGGLADNHPLTPWIESYQVADPNAGAREDDLAHGVAVTSAFLFGAVTPGSPLPRPYCKVSHHRVLDEESYNDPSLELYRTLGHVEEVLLSRRYEFVNLSLGPQIPIEDDDVHAWTSVLDAALSDGRTLLTVAVGNDGELDWESGNARVQPPSDAVNALSVGAASSIGEKWERASYSCIGPGRIPGAVKPDLVAFGGSPREYFHVLRSDGPLSARPEAGTSFASPSVLRMAAGVRAVLGNDLSPLAIKALLVHSAESAGHDRREVGWGRIPQSLDDVVATADSSARVVYQGELIPGKYIRAPLPLEGIDLVGRVRVRATFCYTCPVDPEDLAAYTRAGLDITFRPDETKTRGKKKRAATKSFFSQKVYRTENELRRDAGKWETTLQAEQGFLGSSLVSPVFDIHYNARSHGAGTSAASRLAYALVITISAPGVVDLYEQIRSTYSKILVPMRPQVQIPV